MRTPTPEEVCSFCGTIGDEHTLYAGGFGVLMCSDCVVHFSRAMAVAQTERTPGARVLGGRRRALTRYDVADLSNDEMLEMLPQIAASASLVNRFLADWVERVRERKLSWTAIGGAMSISRQAAWERFTRVLGTERQSHSS